MSVAVTPYLGRRPAPSRRWVPFVVVTGALVFALDLIRAVLNLRERGLQDAARTAPPQLGPIRDTLHALQTVGTITRIALVAYLIAAIGWSVARRTRTRAATDGEAFVEPRLSDLSPRTYVAFILTILLAFTMSLVAGASVHVGMTHEQIATYRTWLALSNLIYAVSWGCLLALVFIATRHQEQREALSPPPYAMPV